MEGGASRLKMTHPFSIFVFDLSLMPLCITFFLSFVHLSCQFYGSELFKVAFRQLLSQLKSLRPTVSVWFAFCVGLLLTV